MKAFQLHGKRDIRLDEIPLPDPVIDEVIVKVSSVGICGSDVHYFKDGKIGSFIPREPFALGHELSGIIYKTAANGSDLSIGTRVAINPSQPCLNCIYCLEGQSHLCANMTYMGSASVYPHQNGGFSEYVKVPAKNCIPLPDTMSSEEAALLEPLSIVLHAFSKAGETKGMKILITGAGTIGQLCLMVAKYYKASFVTVTDVRPIAIQMSQDLGADKSVNVEKSGNLDQLQNYDILFEASGVNGALDQAVKSLKKGGKVIQLGMQHDGSRFPFAEFMKNELSFETSFRFNNEYKEAFMLVAENKLNISKIVTSRYPFANTLDAIMAASDSGKEIKVMIEHT